MSETEHQTEHETESTEISTETVGTAAEAPEVVGAPEAIETPEVAQTPEVDILTAVGEPVEPTESTEPAKPKRRIRGSTLFTAAVVLGVLGGVGTGYAIQYTRPATPLPPLAGSQPAYAPVGVYQGIAPAMLPSSRDDATVTDGDLTKLLLPVPAGANTDDASWLDQIISAEEDADTCTDPVSCFTKYASDGIIAIADTGWTQNGFDIEIRMFRMAPGDSTTARNWAGDSGSTNTIPIPAGIDGTGYEYLDTNNDNDDTAYAAHGDLAVEFFVTSPSTVPSPSIIDALMTQQMGRL
jgi:hypothetical protein